MYAFLSSRLFDIAAALRLPLNRQSEIGDFSRRIVREQTIDGGAVLIDQGYSAGDQTFLIRADIDAEIGETLQYMIENHGEFTLSIHHGCYLGAVQTMAYRPGDEAAIMFLATEKLSA